MAYGEKKYTAQPAEPQGGYLSQEAGKGDYLTHLRAMYSGPNAMREQREAAYGAIDRETGSMLRKAGTHAGMRGVPSDTLRAGVIAGNIASKEQAEGKLRQEQSAGLQEIGKLEMAEQQQHMEGMSAVTATIQLLENMGEIHDEDFPHIQKMLADLEEEVRRTGNFGLYQQTVASLMGLGQDSATLGVTGQAKPRIQYSNTAGPWS